jgi:hypothetical protein
VTLALVLACAAVPASRASAPVRVIRDLSFEFIGQFQNSAPGVTPATHIHYGYLSYIRGLNVFTGEPEDETTALFTFYANAATLRVIVDGPLRIVTRVGVLTIYRDISTDGNFANPDSFRDGTPVFVAGFRQEVVNNTITSSFSTFHQDTITATHPFSAGGRLVQLGVVGEKFRTWFSGQGNMPGPPSGYFGGYAVSG